MKKGCIITLSILLVVVNFICPVLALEKEDDPLFEKISEDYYLDEEGKKHIVATYETDEGILFSDTCDKTIVIYDCENNNLASALVEETPEHLISKKPTSFDEIFNSPFITPLRYSHYAEYYDTMWGTWSDTDYVTYTVSFSGSLTATLLTAITSAAIDSNGVSIKTLRSVCISLLCNLVFATESIINGTTITVKGQYAYNYSCSILRRERMVATTYGDYGDIRGHWYDTPWNYSYPASCRYLEEIYSYN